MVICLELPQYGQEIGRKSISEVTYFVSSGTLNLSSVN